jgi:pimeloyl-ACP methyl ester carboxylesterase
MRHRAVFALAALLSGTIAGAQTGPAETVPTHSYGPQLEGFDYPFPVRTFHTVAQGQSVDMAYMELAPAHPNGRTAVLLHGKNFCGATWGDTARVLAAAGYRVIVPDQVGFCKSSKPVGFQYSMLGLARLTADLLKARGVTRATLIGHSLGGTLAIRMAITTPQLVDQLVLINPIALVDRLAQGVPYADVGRLTALEEQRTPASMKAYQLTNYYHGVWRKSYDRWIDMMGGLYAGPGRAAVIGAQARTTEMLETQPVAYELQRVTVPTVLMVGTLDHNVFGKSWAPQAIADRLPEIGTIGDKAAAKMKNARFVPLTGMGHVPQIEDPARFQVALIQALSGAL